MEKSSFSNSFFEDFNESIPLLRIVRIVDTVIFVAIDSSSGMSLIIYLRKQSYLAGVPEFKYFSTSNNFSKMEI